MARSMGLLNLDSPLTDVSINVRSRFVASPLRQKPGMAAAAVPKPRKNKEDLVPLSLDDPSTRSMMKKDWDGPDVSMARRWSAAMVSVRAYTNPAWRPLHSQP